MLSRNRISVALGLLPILLMGCGKPAGMHVWGDVTYEGKPVETGTIYFSPEDGTTGPSTGGNIVEGKYDIKEKGGPKPDGVYKVAITGLKATGKMITLPKSDDKKPVPEMVPLIPPEYNTNSTLKITVSSDPSKNK